MPSRSAFGARRLIALAAAVAVMLPVSTSQAQGKVVGVIPDRPMPDSAQQVAMVGMGMRMRSPAAMAMLVKEELGLSPEQVAAIGALVQVEADSARSRMARMGELARANRLTSGLASTMSWTGPIDDAAVRAAACEQSRGTAELLIGMMRDRHALGVLLRPDQQRRFDQLQTEMMMRAMMSGVNK